jgi:hypothetical protein
MPEQQLGLHQMSLGLRMGMVNQPKQSVLGYMYGVSTHTAGLVLHP